MATHKNDPITSKIADQSADKYSQRTKIIKAMKGRKRPITARRLAELTKLSYHAVQRRISEIKNIKRGDVVKDEATGRPVTLLEYCGGNIT